MSSSTSSVVSFFQWLVIGVVDVRLRLSNDMTRMSRMGFGWSDFSCCFVGFLYLCLCSFGPEYFRNFFGYSGFCGLGCSYLPSSVAFSELLSSGRCLVTFQCSWCDIFLGWLIERRRIIFISISSRSGAFIGIHLFLHSTFTVDLHTDCSGFLILFRTFYRLWLYRNGRFFSLLVKIFSVRKYL